ncbi:MAG: sugar phosphate isomerase/epimerase family protein [Candidatus Latescibacterota bacterium]|jgi:sugar phosphate isomerase/epimerase
MVAKPEVIISGFADEGPVDKRAESQLTMLAALGMGYYSVRFVDVGNGVKNAMQLTKSEIKRLRVLHGEFGVRVSSLGSPIGKVKLLDVDDDSNNMFVPFARYLKNEVRRAVDLAGELETKLIRGFSFYHPRGQAPEKYVSQAAEQLFAICEECKKAGVFFGLEVEANLIGQSGHLLRQLYKKVNHPNLHLIFDGGNLASQNLSSVETVGEYQAMKAGIGWMHIKDYKIDPNLTWQGHVDEERLKNFVPADRGDSGHEEILRDFKTRIPALERKLKKQGVDGVFLDLEPHLKGGGQFGGISGVDGFGVALRALLNVLDYVGIGYRLTGYGDIERQKG